MDQPAPTTWFEAVWPMVAPAFTSWAAAAFLGAWAITHIVKLWIPVLWPRVAKRAEYWRAVVATTSVIAGAISGAWSGFLLLEPGDWISLAAMTAAFNGLVWRFAVAMAPRRLARVLQTETDREFIRTDTEPT